MMKHLLGHEIRSERMRRFSPMYQAFTLLQTAINWRALFTGCFVTRGRRISPISTPAISTGCRCTRGRQIREAQRQGDGRHRQAAGQAQPDTHPLPMQAETEEKR
jgi:hypothetical protein